MIAELQNVRQLAVTAKTVFYTGITTANELRIAGFDANRTTYFAGHASGGGDC